MASVKKKKQIITPIFFLLSAMLIISCASAEKIEEEISGKWQRNDGDDVVTIDLVKESKSIEFDGKTYPATIEDVDLGAYLVSLKVKNNNGVEENWTLRQVWNNNGSDFKLILNHNGKQETLVHSKQS